MIHWELLRKKWLTECYHLTSYKTAQNICLATVSLYPDMKAACKNLTPTQSYVRIQLLHSCKSEFDSNTYKRKRNPAFVWLQYISARMTNKSCVEVFFAVHLICIIWNIVTLIIYCQNYITLLCLSVCIYELYISTH